MAANGDLGYADGETTPWAELAAEMRRIKVDADLSYGKLAQRTHYSRSSWERFLNQKQLPTRVAVEQFAAASGQDPRPLLLRLEHSLAHESAGAGRAAPERVAPGVVAPRRVAPRWAGAGRADGGWAGAGRAGVPAPVARHSVTARNHRGPGRAGLVRPGLVRPGLVRPGLVRPGLVRPGLVRPGLVRPGLVRPLGLVVAGALLGGLAATLARSVHLSRGGGGARQPRTV